LNFKKISIGAHKFFALGAFLDVERFFDNTSFEAMGKASVDHEVHFMIPRWIAVMVNNRMVRAEISGVSSTMMVRRGCPQEGVLSPLLWNMVLTGSSDQAFVDDITIVMNGKLMSTVCELMQKALFIVQTWCPEVRLSVIADKTSMALFTNNRKLVGFKKPILFGTELQLKNH
jgi:hypothetical protein